MRKIPRAKGYVRGLQNSGEYDIHPFDMDESPDGVYVEEIGRAALPTTAVALEDVQGLFDAGVAVYPSDVAPLGKPFRIAHGVLGYTNGVYLHPTDYYWFRYEPAKAHKMVEGWLDRRLTHMADEAIAKIDRMYGEREFPPHPFFTPGTLDLLSTHMVQTAEALKKLGATAEEATSKLVLVYPEVSQMRIAGVIKRVFYSAQQLAFFHWEPSNRSFWRKFTDWIMGR